jgi:Recombination endonuclease VII
VKNFCEKHNVEKFPFKNGTRFYCRICAAEYAKQRREHYKEWLQKDRIANPERYKEYGRKAYSLHGRHWTTKKICARYGISIDEYDALVEKYNHLCGICSQPEKRKFKGEVTRLSIDHCHKTGKVRGLLCYECNIMLGKAKDSITVLQAAIKYLEQHQ